MNETLFVIELPGTRFDVVPFVVIGAAFVGMGLWLRKRQPTWRTLILCAIGALIVLIGGSITPITQRRHDALFRAYTSGKCQVVEGLVHLDHVEPAEGHDIGEFGRIGGQSFRIGHYPAYDRTVAHGGVLREGAYVRVWLYNDAVLRIDRVPQPGASTPAAPAGRGSAKPPPEEKRTAQVDGG